MVKQLIFSQYGFDVLDFALKNFIPIILQSLRYYYEKPSLKGNAGFFLFNIDNPCEFQRQKTHYYDIIVGVSYCQKPINCPSGRFNDECKPKDLTVCRDCVVNQIRKQALDSNLKFIILTTSFDFARFHLERTNNRMQSSRILYIVSVCPYILNISKLFGFILNTILISFPLTKRGCRNAREFISAEKGGKTERTEYSNHVHNAFLETISHFGKSNKYLK